LPTSAVRRAAKGVGPVNGPKPPWAISHESAWNERTVRWISLSKLVLTPESRSASANTTPVATTAIANLRRRHWRSRSVISHTVGRSYSCIGPGATAAGKYIPDVSVDWDWTRVVFDHVHIRVRSAAGSIAFYKTVLGPLAIPPLWERSDGAQFANLVVSGDAEPGGPDPHCVRRRLAGAGGHVSPCGDRRRLPRQRRPRCARALQLRRGRPLLRGIPPRPRRQQRRGRPPRVRLRLVSAGWRGSTRCGRR